MVKHIFFCNFPKLLEKITFWMETTILDKNASQIFLAAHSQETALKDGF
jgi:hypothetical protein